MTGTAEQIAVWLMRSDPGDGRLYDIEEHKEKRSLSQNSYYWVLAGRVARKLHISTARLHNMLLRDVGMVERMNGDLIPVYIPDTEEAEEQAIEAETYHIKPTSQVKQGKDGKPWRCYVMLRGSHTFNTAEMTGLLDLMIQEAQAQGIETMTPDELAHIREMEMAREKRANINSNGSAAA